MASKTLSLLLLLFLSTLTHSSSLIIPLVSSAAGPESLAFDAAGAGPYTGVADGRILKWSPQTRRWSTFANVPGRPLGLQFHFATGKLYTADAVHGLLAVGPDGGAAAEVAGGLGFANGVDVDQESGDVYLTDSSTRFGIRDYALAVLSRDKTGRLLKFRKGKMAVLLEKLSFPNGVALGGKRGNEFVLVAETGKCRVLRYWLRGERRGEREIFAKLPGYPDNVRKRPRGGFWVGIYMGKLEGGSLERECPVAARLGREGRVEEVKEDCSAAGAVSEVAETAGGEIWVGSVVRPYVEVFNSSHYMH